MVNAEITEEINTRQSWICMADVLRAYQAAEILSEDSKNDNFEGTPPLARLKIIACSPF